MSRPEHGQIDCPLGRAGGTPHTGIVYREQKGKTGAYYYRCDCGTIQPRSKAGQALLLSLVRWNAGYAPAETKPKATEPPPAKPKAEPAPTSPPPEPQPETPPPADKPKDEPRKKRRGLLSALLEEEL